MHFQGGQLGFVFHHAEAVPFEVVTGDVVKKFHWLLRRKWPLQNAYQGQIGQESTGALEARPRRRELRAAQMMAISVRIGGASRAPQLTPAPFATTGIRHDELIRHLPFKP